MPGAVPVSVLSRLARSVNVSRWFRYPAEGSESHFHGFITDADLDLIAALGLTAVRLAVAPAQLLDAGGRLDARRLGWLGGAVRRLNARGLLVVLDYHDESREIECGGAAVGAFEAVWVALAAHLSRSTSPDDVLLEVLNEPVFDADPVAWFPVRRRLVSAVRAAAPLHTVVTGGPNWSSLDGLLSGGPVDDPNVVYTFHFYEPYEFTHQGAPWAPWHVKVRRGVRYTPSDFVMRRIARAAEWAARQAVPVWAGEFGAFPDAAPREDRLRWLHDVGRACERQGIGWALWSYDESLGLDRRLDETGRVRVDWGVAEALGLRVTDVA